ncbi:hypothetical protein G6F37_012136 [Rhizopus arrhizus]|nr:hypothetical protein G6F38_012216 [Rhizopus arrhizus]KAG1145491.1 hypothetical protein G6F37_012136 [Rhizopus arrhizus]
MSMRVTSRISVASLNCRGLKKIITPAGHSFSRYLRSLPYDLLALQETHASSSLLQTRFDQCLQTSSSVWTQHCGLLSLNPMLKIEARWSSLDGRLLVADVSHQSGFYDPLLVYVLYAPATRGERALFLHSLSFLLNFPQPPPYRSVLLGDFNHNVHRPSPTASVQPWLTWIRSFWHDPLHDDSNCRDVPTFRDISTIDHLLVTHDLQDDVDSPNITYVARCNHSAISVSISLGQPRIGPGLWRCNPFLATDPKFRKELQVFCSGAAQYMLDMEVQIKWDYFKAQLKRFVQDYSNKAQARMRQSQSRLQRQRRKLLKHGDEGHALAQVESQLDQLYETSASVLALRSGHKWREQGERSNAYFYRCLKQRQHQAVSGLQDVDGNLVSEPAELVDCAQAFYQDLYSPTPVDSTALDDLLSSIPESVRLSSSDQTSLMAPLTEDEVLACVSRTPNRSSPGVDGLPYEIFRLLLQHPFCRQLYLDVLQSALLDRKYPDTWQRSVVILLPKKGDRTSLKNWRPISLICADAKIFTRLLVRRINGFLPKLIESHQTGFLPNRFIADNGLSARLVMDIAQRYKIPGIGLLLDQEKAYDRVHPTYLQACLSHFGFPGKFVDCISSLFFSTTLCVNVNGFLSSPFLQGRGLRQGDPLSPLLFNLALEPLLRSFLALSQLPGFSFALSTSPRSPSVSISSPVIKSMAYADDVLVLLDVSIIHNSI